MKKLILLSFTVIVVFCSCSDNRTNPDITESIPTHGLIVYYPFNGNANDESGNGNNGTLSTNPPSPSVDRFGIAGRAYSFNGTNNLIRASVQNLPFGSGSRTVSVWAIGDDSVGVMEILGYGRGGGTGGDSYDLNYWKSQLSGQVGMGITLDVDLKYYASNLRFSGQWKHVVGMYESSTQKVFLYIDGEKLVEEVKSLSTSSSFSALLDIGAQVGTAGTQRYFKGMIDDIRIYNRALSDTEIQQLYHEGGR